MGKGSSLKQSQWSVDKKKDSVLGAQTIKTPPQIKISLDLSKVMGRQDAVLPQEVSRKTTKTTIDTSLFWENIQNKPAVYPPAAHSHVKADITDFAHTHVKADITDFAHTHVKADITDFAHTHVKADITDFAHTHVKADITDFAHTHVKADITDFAHTHSPADISPQGSGSNLDADMVDGVHASALVPISRRIIAGTGLTGGGDLSQDRTLSVVDNTTVQKVEVAQGGTVVATRKRLNFIAGANVTISVTDDATNDKADITISSTGGSGGGGIGGSISVGQVAFGTATNTIGGDNNFYWDNTNKRLGIGTTTPGYKLDVIGQIRATEGTWRKVQTITVPAQSDAWYRVAAFPTYPRSQFVIYHDFRTGSHGSVGHLVVGFSYSPITPYIIGDPPKLGAYEGLIGIRVLYKTYTDPTYVEVRLRNSLTYDRTISIAYEYHSWQVNIYDTPQPGSIPEGYTAYTASFSGDDVFVVNTDTNRFVIKSSGNVGIGTTSPSEKLTVSGNILTTGNLTVQGTASINTLQLTNQGHGSGLNADMVDGVHASSLVPTSRQINTGTGLTGGGDLSADRTLSVVDNTTVQKVEVAQGGTLIATRKRLNFIAGTNVTISIADDAANDKADITISAIASGGGSGGIGGSIVAGQVAFGVADNTIGGDNNLRWDNTNKRLGIKTTTPNSPLHVAGAVSTAIRSVSSNTTLTADDYTVLVNASSSSVTISLPQANTVTGRIYVIKKVDSSMNSVTIDPYGSETIDGLFTYTLYNQWDSVIIQSNGSGWVIIATHLLYAGI